MKQPDSPLEFFIISLALIPLVYGFGRSSSIQKMVYSKASFGQRLRFDLSVLMRRPLLNLIHVGLMFGTGSYNMAIGFIFVSSFNYLIAQDTEAEGRLRGFLGESEVVVSRAKGRKYALVALAAIVFLLMFAALEKVILVWGS